MNIATVGAVFDIPNEGDLKIAKGVITWFKPNDAKADDNGNIKAMGFNVAQYVDGNWEGLCPLADFAELYPMDISRLPTWALEAGKKERLAIYGEGI